ncbi:MAG: hypothetical protein ACJ75S_09670 [Solirubrobacterales bacterium]
MNKVVIPFFVIIALLTTAGCGSASSESANVKLEPGDVRPALRTLPYVFALKRIHGPKGNIASFHGRAHGPHDTTLEFSIGIGEPPRPVSVPGAGTKHVVWNEEAGFVFNDDGEIARKFETAAQWREVGRTATKVEQSLCRAATGEPCPV